MDLVIVVVLLAIVIFFFRKFSNIVYFVAILDIFFRIVDAFRVGVALSINKNLYLFLCNIPASMPTLFGKYSSGIIYTVLFWGYVIIMTIFLGYTIRTFFRKKK